MVDKKVNIKNWKSDKIILPIDFQVKNGIRVCQKTIDNIEKKDNILDLGKYSIELFKIYLENSKTIF